MLIRQNLSQLKNQTHDRPTFLKSSALRFHQYPDSKPKFRGEVHAPTRPLRFCLPGNSRRSWCRESVKENSGDKMGNSVGVPCGKALRSALNSLRCCFEAGNEDKTKGEEAWRDEKKWKEVIDLDNELSEEDFSNDSSAELVGLVRDAGEKPWTVSGQKGKGRDGVVENLGQNFYGKGPLIGSSSDLSNQALFFNSRRSRDVGLQYYSIQKHPQMHQLWRLNKYVEKAKQDALAEAFTTLTEKDFLEVLHALSISNRRKILVSHRTSNIDISGEVLYCLRPGEWLNDEVINVYLGLLKERENREPQKFLKCHFFNTFFYKKLINGNGGYNFQSVRRWTSQKKLGYILLDCDKIFVPIHKQAHWCLAVINKKDETFQYLDSLRGSDAQVTQVLARYYVDEVMDKTGKEIDVSSWRHEFVEDLPKQENGFDCGMFMIKYADFYSRGIGLCFRQNDMQYFRVRTAKEILSLKAY